MKNSALSPVLGLLPLLGLTGCGMFSGDRTPEVTNAARLNVAMAAEASGDNQMALQIYATALAKDPTDTKAAVQYARALVNNRQVGLARELLSRQLALRPGQPDLSREFGTIEVLQGQAASAVPRFDVALNANPSDVRALVNKGIALDMLGRHAEAQQLYHRADGLSPDDPAVRNNLAMSLMLHGRTQEAGDVLQGFAGGSSNNPRIRNNMAVLAAANGDMNRARQLTAGEISDVELRSLASQVRSGPATVAMPVGDSAIQAPAIQAPATPVAVAPVAAAPVATAPRTTTPVAAVPVDTGVVGALPLTVPGQDATVTPVTAPVPRAAPARTQDKRGVGRLNMTEAGPRPIAAVIARALEQAIEKEAAFIGEAPTADGGPTLTEGMRILPAVAVSPLRVRTSVAPANVAPVHAAPMPVAAAQGPRRVNASRMGYAVQLAAVGSEAGAQFEWRRLNASTPFLMMGREAVVDQGTRTDGRGFWRLRTAGFMDFSAARQFCDELKLAGRDCFVTGGRSAQAAVVARTAPAAETGPAASAPMPDAAVSPAAPRSPEG